MTTPNVVAVTSLARNAERRLLLTFGVAAFMVSLDARVVAPLLPAIATEFGIESAQAGWVVSSYLLPYGCFQLIYGPVADRLGKIRVAAGAMLVFSVLTALTGAFERFGTLLLLRALTGAAAAALIPLAIAHIGDTVPYGRRQVALSRLMATMGTAHAVSAMVGGAIGELLSWRQVFLPLGLLGGVVASLLLTHRRLELPGAADARERRYVDALRAPQMVTLLLLVAFEGALFMGVLPYLSGLLETRFAMGSLAIGVVLSLSGAAQLLVALFMPWIVQRISERALLIVGGTAMGTAYFVIAHAASRAGVAVGSALVGVGFSLCHSTLQTRATEMFPRGRATALALFAFFLFGGSSLGSVGFSCLGTRVGYGAGFACCGALFFAFTLAVSRVARDGSSRDQDAIAMR